MDAKLHKRVDTDECYWTMSSDSTGKLIEILLQKTNKMEWWNCIAEVRTESAALLAGAHCPRIQGEQEINTKKVSPENSKLSDLKDDETRQMVEKMMVSEHLPITRGS